MVWLLARQRLAGSFSQQGGQVKQDADVLNRLQVVVMVRGWWNNLKMVSISEMIYIGI
jgi:hypothetical protein